MYLPSWKVHEYFSDNSKYGRALKRLSADRYSLASQIPFCDLKPKKSRTWGDIREPDSYDAAMKK